MIWFIGSFIIFFSLIYMYYESQKEGIARKPKKYKCRKVIFQIAKVMEDEPHRVKVETKCSKNVITIKDNKFNVIAKADFWDDRIYLYGRTSFEPTNDEIRILNNMVNKINESIELNDLEGKEYPSPYKSSMYELSGSTSIKPLSKTERQMGVGDVIVGAAVGSFVGGMALDIVDDIFS